MEKDAVEDKKEEKIQHVVALAFTYHRSLHDGSQSDIGLFMRPLDSDIRDSSFFRFFYQRHGISAEKPFQFIAGFIEDDDKPSVEEINNIIQKGWAASEDEARAVLTSLRHLREKAGIDCDLDDEVLLKNKKLVYVSADDPEYDIYTKRRVKVHYCHLHIPNISREDEKMLLESIQPGKRTSVVALIPLDKIKKYDDTVSNKNIFHISVDDCHHVKPIDDIEKLPKVKIFYAADDMKCLDDYQVDGRLVNVHADNAQILFEELLDGELLQSKEYVFPEKIVFRRGEFKFKKELGKGSHASQIETHIPSGKTFIIKFVRNGSKMEKNIIQNVECYKERLKNCGWLSDKILNYQAIMDDMAYSEVLASELYRLHGLNVPKLRIVETVAGKVVASEMIDGFGADNKRLERDPPDEVFKGFGCDLAFANYDSLGNVYDLVVTYSSEYNIGYYCSGENETVVRIDLGGSFLYRAQGLFKNKEFFDEQKDIDIGKVFEINPGFRNVILKNLTEENYEEKIQLAIDTLKNVSDEKRGLCVFDFYYGTLQEKQTLIDLINNRVKSTILALEEFKKVFDIRMTRRCVIL